jgi:glutathione peroxidase
MSIQTIPVRRITGEETTLADHEGKVLLVVNVASKCGLTPQYEGLQNLYQKYRDQGFVITGFPSNDFAGQEPGTNDEIQSFCSLTYSVDFPLYEKITVVGEEKHPLYDALIEAKPTSVKPDGQPFTEKLIKFGINPNPEPEILWNFEKFIVDRSGNVTARFSPDTKPDDPALVSAIETELARQ